jgi:hypothetical protein
MSEHTINRRQAVRAAAGVAAGSVLVAGAGVGSAHANGGDGLVGAWVVAHTDAESGETGYGVTNFIEDGNFVVNDFNPPGPTGTGMWEWRDDSRFRAVFWAGNADDGSHYSVHIWGRHDDHKISGRFTVTAYDPDGNEVGSFDGTFSGKPLTF